MRVLIVRLSAIGDVVIASPVPRLIKQAHPEARVCWAVQETCADLVRGNPFVDRAVVLPASRRWREWVRRGRVAELGRALLEGVQAIRRERFDVVLDLQGLFKSALVAAVARSARKIMPDDAGERLPWVFTACAPRRLDPRHDSSMYTSLLQPLGIHPRSDRDYRLVMRVDRADQHWARRWLAAHGLEPAGYVACAPRSSRPQKNWPAGNWPPLLQRLHAAYGLPALLLGTADDRPLLERIAGSTASPVVAAAGETRLGQASALLESARLTVGLDTGPTYLAVAVGCPTLALFGSTGPRIVQDGVPYVWLHRHFACWPCHRHPTCRRHECLRAIRPGDVERAAARLLAARPDGGMTSHAVPDAGGAVPQRGAAAGALPGELR